VYEALGDGLTLISLDDDNLAAAEFAQVAADLHMPLTIISDDIGSAAGQYGARYILVRPDQFVCWVGDDLSPGDAEIILRQSAGHTRQTPRAERIA
jgi:hypothetical protein